MITPLSFVAGKKCCFWVNRSSNPKWTYKLTEAREMLKKRLKECEEKDIEAFFVGLNIYPVGERINRTFRYLKNFRKKGNRLRWNKIIRLEDWVIDDSSISLIPEPSVENAEETLPDAPTLQEIEAIIDKMKNGKTPGVDGLYAEFFKYSDNDTIRELHCLLVKVWLENQMPCEWKHVLVIPIAKVKNPKQIDVYHRICLSCTSYKIYAIWILNRLQNNIVPIGLHQAACLPGRSTTDHLFVLQRILQESWNAGESLILMSLDIEKAFDRVSLLPLPAILKGEWL